MTTQENTNKTMSDFWMSQYNYNQSQLAAALKRLRYVCVDAIDIEDGHHEEVYLRVPATTTVENEFAPWYSENYRITSARDVSRDEFLEAVVKPVPAEVAGGEF